jgi:ribonuclease HII
MPAKARTALQRWQHDKKAAKDMAWLVGVDEVGRGAFVGNVIAAAVAAPPVYFEVRKWGELFHLIGDSKTLSAEQRQQVFTHLTSTRWEAPLLFATGEATVAEIEQHNVVGATCLAMDRALQKLTAAGLPRAEFAADELFASKGSNVRILVDGRPMRRLAWPHQGIIKGDDHSHLIALASILAKVTRDAQITLLGEKYPQYQWQNNKGYGTPAHLEAIRQHGPCLHHRNTFLKKLALNRPGLLAD